MKRLISKQEKERKERKNQTIIGLVLVFIMVSSVIGFGLMYRSGGNESGADGEKIVYNGFEFTYVNGFWTIGGFSFRYNPQEAPDIGEELADGTYYAGLPLYVYSESLEAEREIFVNLGNVAERIQQACPEEEQCSEDIPTKNCENNFIIIKESENERIFQIENCVYIEGSQENLAKLADSFLFKILGVR